MKYDYDAIVLGAGPVGMVASKVLHGMGKKTALIEKNKIGGDCTWYGCVPSKALVKSGIIAHAMSEHSQYGIEAVIEHFNAKDALRRARQKAQHVGGFEPAEVWEKAGIDVVMGEFGFSDSHTLSEGNRQITAKKILVSTGARAFIPDISGLKDVPYLTNQTLFDLQEVPESMLILGAGPIGVEMASAFVRLGCKVFVLNRSKGILNHDDPDFSSILRLKLEKEGVVFIEEMDTLRFWNEEGKIAAEFCQDEVCHTIRADRLLIAAGRTPETEALHVDKAGIALDSRGFITVNQNLQTSVPHIYACGDCTGGYMFTHVAEYEAVTAATNMALPFNKSVNYDHVAWCTYTDPELAQAGLTEAQAREKYGDSIQIYTHDYAHVDRGICEEQTEGKAKFILDKKGYILGATILGERAAELINLIQVVKTQKIPFYKIGQAIHVYPSYNDVIRQPSKRAYIDHLQKNPFLKIAKALFGKKGSNS